MTMLLEATCSKSSKSLLSRNNCSFPLRTVTAQGMVYSIMCLQYITSAYHNRHQHCPGLPTWSCSRCETQRGMSSCVTCLLFFTAKVFHYCGLGIYTPLTKTKSSCRAGLQLCWERAKGNHLNLQQDGFDIRKMSQE